MNAWVAIVAIVAVAADMPDLQSMMDEAMGHYQAGRLAETRAVALELLELFAVEHPDDPPPLGPIELLASVAYQQGDFAAAASRYTTVLAAREAHHGPGHIEVGNTLSNLGAIYIGAGEYGKARAVLKRALAIAEGGEDPLKLAAVLHNLGDVYVSQFDIELARDTYLRALRIREEHLGPDDLNTANTLTNYAGTLRRLGFHIEARLALERAVTVFEGDPQNNARSLAAALNNLGQILQGQGDWEVARSRYERAVGILLDAYGAESSRTVLARGNLAFAMHHLGETDAAREMFEEAIAVGRATLGRRHRSVETVVNNYAVLLFGEGEYALAESMHREDLASARKRDPGDPGIAAVLGNLSEAVEKRGDREEARALQREALDIRLRTYGEVHPESILTQMKLAALIDDDLETQALLGRATVNSVAYIDEILPALSEREALIQVADQRGVLDVFMYAGADERVAYEAMLEWKGAVNRALAGRRRAIRSDEGERLRQQLATARRDLAAATLEGSGDVARIGELRERLEREIATASQDARAHLTRREIQLEEICAMLPKSSVLVDYLHLLTGESAYIAFVLDRNRCRVRRVDLGPAAPIEAAVSAHHQSLAAGDQTARVDRRGEVVRDLVWAPLEIGAGEVFIVPDGALASLAFSALPDGDAYLLESTRIRYLERAYDLLRYRNEPTSNGNALLVGDVDYGAGDGPSCAGRFDGLPATEGEIAAISQIWAKRRRSTAEVWAGRSPTEERIVEVLEDRELIHFATHGFFASSECRSLLDGGGVGFDPAALSGLVLAGANDGATGGYDGILTAAEVVSQNLDGTRLVVLSACETGLGDVRSGEGVLGLRRAFSVAGVRALVMSLWSVPDEATAALMGDFYGGLLHKRKPLGVADALRAAQLDALERNRRAGDARPADWAVFVSTGDWR